MIVAVPEQDSSGKGVVGFRLWLFSLFAPTPQWLTIDDVFRLSLLRLCWTVDTQATSVRAEHSVE
jgi:hypothetical protein